MLKQTKKLIKKYGSALVKGTISDADLHELLTGSSGKKPLFKKYPENGFVDPDKGVSNRNFSVMDGMKDFARHIAPKMSAQVLHEITARLIQLSPATIESNTFMRNASLAKAFLAYEIYAFPDNAEEHFRTMRMQKEFPGVHDIANLQCVILEPIISFFEESLKVKRRNSVQGFAEPAPQMPLDSLNLTQTKAPVPVATHQRLPSEPVPVAPDLTATLLALASLKNNEANQQNDDSVAEPSTSNPALPISPSRSPRRTTPFKRSPATTMTKATTVSSDSNEEEKNSVLIPAPTEQDVVVAPTAINSQAANTSNNDKTILPKPAITERAIVRPSRTAAVENTQPQPRLNPEADATLSALIKLCRNYAGHLGRPAPTEQLAQDKLDIVNEMLAQLENPRVLYAAQKIRNMTVVLTPENKEILSEQRSSIGMKFLETVLHILTIGIYSKYTKNTFSFWKSHGEALSDDVEQLTKNNNLAINN